MRSDKLPVLFYTEYMNYRLEEDNIILTYPEESELTVQDVLEKLIPSRKLQHNLLQEKKILLAGSPARRQDLLAGKELSLPLGRNECDKKEGKKVEILYRDPFCIIAWKEAGLLVHSDGSKEKTLTSLLEAQRGEKLQAIHRLDKETAGLVFFSRSPVFQPLFDQMLEKKEISREYLAFVSGRVGQGKEFVAEEAIGRDRHDSRKRRVSESGQPARTVFTCLSSSDRFSILHCRLDTGRTHQIRVHCAYHGHPILNDELYGKPFPELPGMGLFAYRLRFFHPFLEKEIVVEKRPGGAYGEQL